MGSTRVGLGRRTLCGRLVYFFLTPFLYLMHPIFLELSPCLSIPFLGKTFNFFKVHLLDECVCVYEKIVISKGFCENDIN